MKPTPTRFPVGMPRHGGLFEKKVKPSSEQTLTLIPYPMANQRAAGKKKVGFWLSEEDHAALKCVADARQMTVTEWVLANVNRELPKTLKKTPKKP